MREKLLESLRRMKDGAKKNVDEGISIYAMHANCALEFADLALKVLEAEELKKEDYDGWDKITITSDKVNKTFKTKVWCFISVDTIEHAGQQIVKIDGKGSQAILLYARLKAAINKLDRTFPEIGALYTLAKIDGIIEETEEEENLYADSSDGNKE